MLSSDSALEARFVVVADEWHEVIAPLRAPDEARFEVLRAEARSIRSAGRWVSGPADLLSILGRHRDELFHSRVLGWLLDPTGRHGLGDRFLRAMLDEIWPGDSLGSSGTVEVERERTRSGMSDATGEILEARADLVINLDSAIVVVVNKLDAGEQQNQCERLYWAWAHDAEDVRWIYLTPSGRPPASTTSEQSRAAWRAASYRDIRRVLAGVLAKADASPGDLGRDSAHQYLATLIAQGNP